MQFWFRSPLVISWVLAALFFSTGGSAAEIDFDRDIAPLLASHCLDCHSGPAAKGGLDLSSRSGLEKGGESGAAIVARKSATSLVFARVRDGEMPPKKKLAAHETALLAAWIDAGAKWGTDPIDPYRISTSTRAGRDWWSLQPVKVAAIPEDQDVFSSSHPIDRFIGAKLAEAKLAPSPPALRRDLIRRLSFDLLGLPPSPEAIEAFENDKRADAYERLVDELLASRHYGERWARHWLDVAHFGESNGFEYDRMRPHAWRYRDWVIEALNSDMPYDQFAREQIAGDLLRRDAKGRPTREGIIATGFLVAGAFDDLKPAGDTMRAIMRQDEMEELVASVTQSFLGLTANCARCHDHKFDPIKQTDYYRIAAALSGVQRGDREVIDHTLVDTLRAEQMASTAQVTRITDAVRARLRASMGGNEQTLAQILATIPEPIAAWNFADSETLKTGKLPLHLRGGAKVESGALVLDGETAYAESDPLPVATKAKTLLASVKLDSLDQRAGGVVSLQLLDGNQFDAIVYGEQEPRRWMAGSDFFKRTKSLAIPDAESAAAERWVTVAMVYSAEGDVTFYRDGVQVGDSYRTEKPLELEAGKSNILLGLRHSPVAKDRLLQGKIARAAVYGVPLSREQVAALDKNVMPVFTTEQIEKEMTADERATYDRAQASLRNVSQPLALLLEQKSFAITPKSAEVTHLLLRGNPQNKADVIAPQGLSAVAPHVDWKVAADSSDEARRLALAHWITSPENPLFARTMVNRVWQYHFGRGLVETPNDLGFSGGLPTHPELLDYLAHQFASSGFRLKSLHKLMVTSKTYQQASLSRADCIQVDADNKLLWRMSPRRLDAESLRDAMLLSSGQLNTQYGGESFHDFRPYVHKSSQYYEPIDPVGAEFHRRSIYRMWARGGRSPLLDTFDCPDPSTAAPRRASTTTPLQALSLLNSSFTLRMADSFASRLEKEAPASVEQQVERAFLIAYGRAPSAAELAASVTFAKHNSLSLLCRVLLNSSGFLYVY
ncbi:protein of unknown function DUF1549 [Pirellula staleyi DSM 6068]|uniref:Cytochrome c domain-containing protein n=1 Tax=Pirellula staleyi (strain ATCC 27377 / DSM 6068 / ICPB 4128) TaxID=530564 RepID=D2R2W9_PIRSD|nr:DUF1553 domain-containing protein [Pirellula staleyi]ADB18702.1 protein of unknown function DUF1549 [Pirellula staleyi DSM 6068]